MNFGGTTFVLAIIALSIGGWMFTTWIRAKHGYPVENEWGGRVHKQAPETDRLVAENRELKETVGKLEERLKVLERNATDPSRQLADDIEQLR